MNGNQIINHQNYFSLFDLPVALPVNRQKLTLSYQRLQRLCHPDNFVAHSESVKNSTLRRSADINLAYQTLKDPVSSIEYLLALKGIVANIEQTTTTDQSFLMQQFELREQLDYLQNLTNNVQKQQVLSRFNSQIEQIWRSAYEQALTTIKQSNWSSAITCTNKLRFLGKLRQSIQEIEDQLFEI